MKPKITVIIPIYNVEKYLSRCLDSVCNQSLSDLEIILINDGSTDNSLKIIDEYKIKDKRIIGLNQKNQGQAAARNAGIKLARGKYISFVDSDDWIAPDMLETLYNHAASEGSDIVMCSIMKAYSLDKIVSNVSGSEFIVKITSDNISEESYKYFFEYEGASLCNKLFKSEMILNYDCNSVRLPLGEDMILNLKLLTFMPKISFINESLYYYFANESSITHKYSESQISTYAIAMKEVIDLATTNGILEDMKKVLPLIVFRGFSTTVFNCYSYNNRIAFLRSKIKEMLNEEIYYHWIRQGITSRSTQLIKNKSNKLHTDIVFFLLSKRLYLITSIIEWMRFMLVTSKKN
ncbi:MAG: hypothetical protein CVU84_00740 [Firmicutes bacterium HGW-Firmicutes-1]|jgi:glycosyltransferase involved in cell wall biosynthesis|nr:MAG: hypothetical protein CVU84_00740 [Firmicutes bacterium HGW-Firmicutes-1]